MRVNVFIRVGLVIGLMMMLNFVFAQQTNILSSPDGKLRFSFVLTAEGSIGYSIEYQGQPVVLHSLLGLNGWEKGFTIAEVSFAEKDTSWKPVYGERSIVRDRYKEMVVALLQHNSRQRELRLRVRAYNEGIAFRYELPEHPDGGRDISIRQEFTEFSVPEGTMAWFTSAAQGHYRRLPLSNWSSASERPLTLEYSNGLYVSLAEAEMVNYSRTRFVLHPQKKNTLTTAIYGAVDFHTPFATPWRVVMVAERPGDLLVNNDIILNLNPPCAIEDTDWIKPGKVIREISLSTQGAVELVDFAVKRNLQYIHFDAGWYGYEYIVASDATRVDVDPRRNPRNDLDLPQVIRYASKKGIGVILYVNQRALYQQLDELLPLYQQWGVKGIKFGFVHVGSQQWTTWLHEAVKKCAKYNLMVNIHDEYRPTGFSRTYPNLMTQEGVRGNEEFPEATNSTILPFTRFIAGAADHTICYYHRPELKDGLNKSGSARVMKTTSGHQLALAVVLYSPLQYLYWYDKPEDSKDEPELEFFDRVSTVWDDTRVLSGVIGEHVTIARRKGKEWFIGSVTNTEGRELSVSLDFLEPGKKYQARIYYDDSRSKSRTKVSIRNVKVNSKSVLPLKLAPSGGQAVWIREQ